MGARRLLTVAIAACCLGAARARAARKASDWDDVDYKDVDRSWESGEVDREETQKRIDEESHKRMQNMANKLWKEGKREIQVIEEWFDLPMLNLRQMEDLRALKMATEGFGTHTYLDIVFKDNGEHPELQSSDGMMRRVHMLMALMNSGGLAVQFTRPTPFEARAAVPRHNVQAAMRIALVQPDVEHVVVGKRVYRPSVIKAEFRTGEL